MISRTIYYLWKMRTVAAYDRDQIRRFQEQNLLQTIPEAGSHPYYSRFWGDAGFDPATDFGSLDDLDQVPIADEGIKGAVVLPAEEVDTEYHLLGSSGTTGERYFSMIDPETADWKAAIELYAKGDRGLSAGSTMLRFPDLAIEGEDRGWLARRALRIPTISRRAGIREQAERIATEDPEAVLYYGHMLFAVAKYVRQHPIEASFDLAFTTGQVLTPGMIETIEAAFDCTVCDVYGSAEAGEIAYQCPETGRYHCHEMFNVVQTEPVGGAERVITTQLQNHVAPVIRYRDAALIEDVRDGCPCGSAYRSFDRVLGRAEAVHELDGERVYQADILEAIDGSEDLLMFSLDIKGSEIVVRYVPNADFDKAVLPDVADALRELGFDTVTTERVEDIERTPGGKLRTFRR